MAVYFIQNLNTGHIKIGKSSAVQSRLISLSKNVGVPLELLGVMEGDTGEERDIQKHFATIRFQGEWFHSKEILLRFIEKHTISLDDLAEIKPEPDILFISTIHRLAPKAGYKNVSQFSIAAGLSWTIANHIWKGDLSNRALKTLVKAKSALNCNSIEDLYEVQQ